MPTCVLGNMFPLAAEEVQISKNNDFFSDRVTAQYTDRQIIVLKVRFFEMSGL